MKTLSGRVLVWLVGAILPMTLLSHPAAGQQTRSWDHSRCTARAAPTSAACTPVFQVTAQPGEKITLQVTNTCPDLFTYDVVPIPLPPESKLQGKGTACTQTYPVEILHDPRYGGYIVYVTRKAGATPEAGDARVTISVRTSEWKLGFGGGFTINGLVDPAFALREVQVKDAQGNAATRYQLVEQKDRKDDVNRSVASFVHLHHTNWELRSWGGPGLSFGLGVEPERGGEYYFGPSWLFGDRGALTLGAVVGQVRSLPAGRRILDTISDANALANLGSRRAARAFIGISYSFLGGGRGDLEKPFKGAEPPATTGGGSGSTSRNTTPGTNANTNTDTTLKIIRQGEETRTGALGAALADPLVVEVQSGGKPLQGALITWTVQPARANGITVTPGSGVTDQNGLARTTVKMGTATESQNVVACVSSAPGKCTSATTEFSITVKQ